MLAFARGFVKVARKVAVWVAAFPTEAFVAHWDLSSEPEAELSEGLSAKVPWVSAFRVMAVPPDLGCR